MIVYGEPQLMDCFSSRRTDMPLLFVLLALFMLIEISGLILSYKDMFYRRC